MAGLSLLSAGNSWSDELKDVLVVSIAPLDDLLSDVKYIGELANQPGWHDIAKGSLANIGQGLKGLDRSRPWGALVTSDGEQFGYVGVLPVSSLKDLLKGLEGFVGKAKKSGSIYELNPPASGMPIFVKEQGKWAFIGQSAEALEAVPADPAVALSDLTGRGYDIGIRANCANIADKHKEMAIGFMEQGMQQGMQKTDDESDEEHEARQKMMELQLEQMKKAINELDEISLGLLVDSSAKHGRMEMVVSGKEGTDMAKELSGYKSIDSKYSGFWDKAAAVTAQFCMAIPPEAAERAVEQALPMKDQMIDTITANDEIESEEDKELVKKLANFFFDQLIATIKKGKYDLGMKVDMGGNQLSMVGGAFVADGTKFEEMLRELDAEVKKKEGSKYPGIKFDAAKVGSVELHAITVPVPEDEEEARKMFGENLNLIVGTGPTDIFVSLGKDAKALLETAVKGVSSSAKTSDLPIKARISLAQVLEFASSVSEEAKVELASNIIKESPDADGILLTAEFEDGKEKVQYTLEEGVLRLLSRSAELAEENNE